MCMILDFVASNHQDSTKESCLGDKIVIFMHLLAVLNNFMFFRLKRVVIVSLLVNIG